MAIRAADQITLSYLVDVSTVRRFYCLAEEKPDKPTTYDGNPPEGWSDTQPRFSEELINYHLYFVDLTVLSNDEFVYTQVSVSSSFDAAKRAFTIANTKNSTYWQDEAPSAEDNDLQINDTWFDTDDGNKMYFWNGEEWQVKQLGGSALASGSLNREDLFAAGIISADLIAADAITSDKIVSGAITTGKLDTAQLAANNALINILEADEIHAFEFASAVAEIGKIDVAVINAINNGDLKISGSAVTIGNNGVTVEQALNDISIIQPTYYYVLTETETPPPTRASKLDFNGLDYFILGDPDDPDNGWSTIAPQMTEGKPYLWMYTFSQAEDGTQNINGPILIGAYGRQGVDGKNGTIHIRYSDDLIDFTANNGKTQGKYIGIYTDNVEEDSWDFSRYQWSQIVGDQGQQGPQGEPGKNVSSNNLLDGTTFDTNGFTIPRGKIYAYVANGQQYTIRQHHLEPDESITFSAEILPDDSISQYDWCVYLQQLNSDNQVLKTTAGNTVVSNGSIWSIATDKILSGCTSLNLCFAKRQNGAVITSSSPLYNQDYTINYAKLKLERGEIRTAWNQSLADTLKIVETETSLKIDEKENQILSKVGSTYVSNEQLGQQMQRVNETFVTQTDSKWQVMASHTEQINKVEGSVNKAQQAADSANANATAALSGLQQYQSTVAKYMDFTAQDGLVIGESTNGQASPFTMNLTNQKLAFKQNGSQVAYISNSTMHITQAEIGNKMTLGNFKFEVDTSGNLNLVYIG